MARQSARRGRALSWTLLRPRPLHARGDRAIIDESQITFLEDIMWDRGYFDTKQMAGAFQLLRLNDLIWSYRLHNYLLGRRQPMNDLMTWNADATRMPYRMHSEYLRQLFLNNDLAEGRYKVNGKAVALTDIRAPDRAL